MNVLQALHDLQFNTGLARLFPTPYALATLVLFVWSFVFLFQPRPSRAFTLLLRVTWVTFLLPAVTGVILALGGLKVPSAVAAPGRDVTKYGFLPDPSRNWEHWMYALFGLISLVAIEALLAGRAVPHRTGLRFLPVVTLFLYGVAYMVGRVAVLPGSTPGT